jgi:hypothetical protein
MPSVVASTKTCRGVSIISLLYWGMRDFERSGPQFIYVYVSPAQMLLCAFLVLLALTHARAARVYLLDDDVEDQGKVSFQGHKNG